MEEDVNQNCDDLSCSGEGKEDIPEDSPEKTHAFRRHSFGIFNPKFLALMLLFLFGPLPAFGIEGSPTLATTLENQPIFLATPTTSEKITILTALVFTHNRLCRAQDPVIPLKPPRPMTNNTFERIDGMLA